MASKPQAVEPEHASARRVHHTLQHSGPLATRELLDETSLTRSQITHALTRLRDQGLVEARPDTRDPRGNRYYPTGEAGGDHQ